MTNPTLNQLYLSIKDDIKAKLYITTFIGKTFLNTFALVQAAKLKLLYLLANSLYNNIFVDTADAEMLNRFGLVKLNRLQAPATAGVYEIDVTGDIGAVIIVGTTYKSLDSSSNPGKLFIVDSQFTFTGTAGTIQIRALDLGSSALIEVTDQLQVTAPIANVDSFAEVSAIITTPTDAESEEQYRKEVIRSYQTEAQGGARTDYRIWAGDASGVQEVYPYVVSGGTGTLDLFVEATKADSTDGNGTPSAGILADVEAVVEFDPDTLKPLSERGRRPIGTGFQINFLPVIPLSVDIVITSLSDVSYLPTILSTLDVFLEDIRPYIAGADNVIDANRGKLYEADMYDIVRSVVGVNATFDSLIMKVNTIQLSVYEFTGENIPYANTVTSI